MLLNAAPGVNENVPNVFNRVIARGDHITGTDVDTRRRVAVLGASVARQLFPDVDPMGFDEAVDRALAGRA